MKPTIRYVLIALSTLLILNSCGLNQQFEARTVDDVSPNLYGPEATALQSDTCCPLGQLAWTQMFRDTTLRQLIASALSDNLDLKNAQLRIDQANAGLRVAHLNYLPSLAINTTGILSSFGGDKLNKTYEIPLVASWQVSLGNVQRNERRAAEQQTRLVQDARQSIQCQIVGTVANIYYTLAMVQSQLAVAHDMEQSWQQTIATMHALMQAGQGNSVAVAQMQAARQGVQVSIVEMERQQHDLRNALCSLLAKPTGSLTDLNATMDEFSYPDTINVGLPLQLLQNRPDVRLAEDKLAAMFYQVQVARGQFYPNFSLTMQAGFTNSLGGMIINPGKVLLSAIGSLAQPLFAKGQLTANLRIQQAEYEIAANEFVTTLLNAGNEVNNALAACDEAHKKEQLLDMQINNLNQALHDTQLLMQYGTNTYLDVLTARQSLLQARLALVASKMLTIQSVISLYTALGGGEQ